MGHRYADDKGLALLAVKKDSWMFRILRGSLKKDKQFVIDVLNEGSDDIASIVEEEVPEEVQNDVDVALLLKEKYSN